MVHYKELEFKLQAQEGLKEHFERDKPRDDFNINNKSHVLQSLVGVPSSPKEWNRENFFQGTRVLKAWEFLQEMREIQNASFPP